MSNVFELTEYFINNEFIKDLNTNNTMGTGGYLALVYAELIKELWCGKDDYVSPWAFKRLIEKFASQVIYHNSFNFFK
jgi:ubiquitin carboxyl-terminal hydrolase 4/11